ncbi:MAG: ribonuclease III [Candidatus Pacebacteria bacterium]|nr:ribonuclease III [Candidatus Paceibacterota bacterium]
MIWKLKIGNWKLKNIMVRSYSELEEKLEVKFNNIDLLKEALTHRSFLNEKRELGEHHNERLEFLGDAVLELAVTRFLFYKFSEKPEGELTSLRAALVNSKMLFEVASDMGVEKFLRLSKGEEKESGKGRNFILANTFEALIGAIYLDQGYEKAEEFVKKNICLRVDEVIEKKLWRDAKSLFQEEAQERESITPNYEVLEASGPDHKKLFVIGVYIGSELVAKGEGFSKHEAEMNAAEKALKEKGWAD